MIRAIAKRRKLKVKAYTQTWHELQRLCSQRKTWPNAVREADRLLDRALKQRGYKGKTTGERLVSAQHDIKFNEEIWFSHKFSKKVNEPGVDVRKLKKKDVAMALAGFRAALRDLGALETKVKEVIDIEAKEIVDA
jgi:hypothetical protein